ncbi:hypothetical protein DLE60_13530, partial [Micromonospora globispora]
MFGTTLLERRSKPERITDQAWQHLVSAASSAGDSVRSARRSGSDLADGASELVGSAADEARRRAT